MNVIIKIVLCILLSLIYNACTDDSDVVGEAEEYTYTVPVQREDGWETASLSEVGMNVIEMVEMMNFINHTQEHQIHDILVVKNKKLVFEEYFTAKGYSTSPPMITSTNVTYDMKMLHYWASVSKSVTSVLFGIAIDKGFINNDINKKIINYLPQYTSILTGEKENITVKHLLTMSSGLDWDENTYPYGDSRNDVTQLFLSSDPIAFVLNKNLHASPGTVFHYNSGVTNVLAEIIRQKAGFNLLQFAKKYLFQPLGITQYEWQKLRGEYYFASGGLSLRPRDMAKIGFLFLNEGKWNGNQILSKQWIDASKQSYIIPGVGFANGYGYQWWTGSAVIGENVINYFFAAGLGEQYMFIIPELDLIIVFNCGYFSVPVTLSPFQLIEDYIAPSLFPGL